MPKALLALAAKVDSRQSYRNTFYKRKVLEDEM